MRDNVLKTMGDVAKTMLQLSGSHPEYVGRIFSEMGEAKSEAEVKKIAGFMARGEYEVNVHKTQWLSLLGVAVDIAPMIAGLPWTVMETGEYEIVTTDAPVVKILTDKLVPRKFAGGWLSPSAEATFALDPCHVLVISQDASEGLRREAPSTVGKECQHAVSRSGQPVRLFPQPRSLGATGLQSGASAVVVVDSGPAGPLNPHRPAARRESVLAREAS